MRFENKLLRNEDIQMKKFNSHHKFPHLKNITKHIKNL